MTLINQQRDAAHRPRVGNKVVEQRAYWFNLHCTNCGHNETPHDCPCCGCGGGVYLAKMDSAIADEPCSCLRCTSLYETGELWRP